MLPTRNWLRSTALAGLVLSGSGILLAQQPERPKSAADAPQRSATRANPGDRTATSTDARGDGALAACLIIDNNKEIALAELAQQHAQNKEVQEFASQMIEDHGKMVQELQQIAASAGYQEQQLALTGKETGKETGEGTGRTGTPARRATTGADTAESRTNRDADDRRTARPAELDGAQSAQAIDFISLKHEVAEKCLQTAREELGQKPEEFDMHYMGAQIMAHQAMVDTLAVFAKHASPELQQTLEQGQQTAQKHLDHAKRIKEQLAKSSDSQQTRQPRESQGDK